MKERDNKEVKKLLGKTVSRHWLRYSWFYVVKPGTISISLLTFGSSMKQKDKYMFMAGKIAYLIQN